MLVPPLDVRRPIVQSRRCLCLDLDLPEVPHRGRGRALGTALGGADGAQPALFASQVPAVDVEDGDDHVGGAAGAPHAAAGCWRCRRRRSSTILSLLDGGVRGVGLAELAQDVRLGVLGRAEGLVGGLGVRGAGAAAVAEAVSDVDVLVPADNVLVVVVVAVGCVVTDQALPTHTLHSDALASLGPDPLEALPPVLEITGTGGRKAAADTGHLVRRGDAGGAGGAGGGPRDRRQRPDVVETLELRLKVLHEVLASHGDAADRADDLGGPGSLAAAAEAEVLGGLGEAALLGGTGGQEVGRAGRRRCHHERVEVKRGRDAGTGRSQVTKGPAHQAGGRGARGLNKGVVRDGGRPGEPGLV